MKKVLAINSRIGSSLGIFDNGIPIFCIEEERLNRKKNWMGFPELSLKYILEKGLLTARETDGVAIVNENEQSNLVKDEFYEKYDRSFENALGLKSLNTKNFKKALSPSNQNQVSETAKLVEFGFGQDKHVHYDHHECHAAAAYYGLVDDLEKEFLILTLDGGGDGRTCTISKGINGKITKLASTNNYSIGNMYSAVTYFLGFTPHEHEYKLMGLAPYPNKKYAKRYISYFENFITLLSDDTEFCSKGGLCRDEFLRSLRDDLTRDRFDNIAAGIQGFCEDLLLRWVKGCMVKYNISNILCSGGVFMNVKANQKISQLAGLESFQVFPSCGDETNIFGAAWLHHSKKNTFNEKFLTKFTLGPSPGTLSRKILTKYSDSILIHQTSDPETYIGESVAKGKIVARCSGPMEFGARALGNRSILADPRNLETVGKINRAIKQRDFWMPFAPSVLWDKANEILHIPPSIKKSGSPYMMLSFDSIKKRRSELACVIQQADFTLRAQTVSKDLYPELYKIINTFYNKTGTPGVLNTSFNLHGFPIVTTADEALEVFMDSELDVLVIDNLVINKK